MNTNRRAELLERIENANKVLALRGASHKARMAAAAQIVAAEAELAKVA